MRYSTPQDFYNRWIGKSVDVDNYPPRQPDQCWDLKVKFVLDEGLKVNTYCNLTGYAGDLYKLRYEKELSTRDDIIKNQAAMIRKLEAQKASLVKKLSSLLQELSE